MMEKKRTALICGATGLIGRHCVRVFAQSGEFSRVSALTRRTISEFGAIPNVDNTVIDFASLHLHKEDIHADDIVCALGTTMKSAGSKEAFYEVDFTYTTQIAQYALENGAGHFLLVSAMGANPNAWFFYNRVKGEVEEHIKNMGYSAVTIMRPSLLLGDRETFRFGEEIGKFFARLGSPVIPKKYRPICAETVAKALLARALNSRAGITILESDEIRDVAGKSVILN